MPVQSYNIVKCELRDSKYMMNTGMQVSTQTNNRHNSNLHQ